MPVPRAGAGMCPGAPFLASPKKEGKEGDPSLRPLRGAKGKPAAGRLRVRRGTRFAAAQRRSDNHGESDHEAWAHGRPCHPRNRPPQAQPAGGEQPNSHWVVAALDPARKLRPARGTAPDEMGPSEAMARNGCSCLAPHPSVCAEERSGQRIRARDCLSEAQRSEFERDPAGREHRRLPNEAQGRRQWGRLFAYFFGEAKKVKSPPGR